MELIVDRVHLGRFEKGWRRSKRVDGSPLLNLGGHRRVILGAPHPDDEVLDAGGLLQTFFASHTPVEVFAVTDGDGSRSAGGAVLRYSWEGGMNGLDEPLVF